MRSKFAIITRFNAPVFSTRQDLAKRRLDTAWLKERIRLFKIYCYPSVMNQSFREFEWIVWCHPDSPEWMKKEMMQFDGAIVIYNNSYQPYIDTSVDILATTRLDNDDMIHRDFMKTLREYLDMFKATGFDRQIYSFTEGFKFYEKKSPRLLYESRRIAVGSLIGATMENNPFLTLFANLKQAPATDTDHLVYCKNHGTITDEFPTAYNNSLSAWVWIYHANNTAGIKTIPGKEVNATILEEFGHVQIRI